MWFVDAPRWLPEPPPIETGRGRILHMLSCLATIALGAAPWNEIACPRLWGWGTGPRGWHTTPGSMTTMVALMVLGLTLIEGRTVVGREAARPGILMLSWLGALPMLWRLYEGPGTLRGVTAEDTYAFWLATMFAVATAAIASWRLRTDGRVPTTATADGT